MATRIEAASTSLNGGADGRGKSGGDKEDEEAVGET
jgi:hypothetical protein